MPLSLSLWASLAGLISAPRFLWPSLSYRLPDHERWIVDNSRGSHTRGEKRNVFLSPNPGGVISAPWLGTDGVFVDRNQHARVFLQRNFAGASSGNETLGSRLEALNVVTDLRDSSVFAVELPFQASSEYVTALKRH